MTKNNNNNKNNKQNNKLKKEAISVMHGQGGYYSDKIVPFMRSIIPDGTFAKAGNTLGGMAGGALGSYVAQPRAGAALGSAAGSQLGGKLAQFLGFGKYTVRKNSLLKEGGSLGEGVPLPSFGLVGHETRVRHREYIKDIVVPSTPSAFSLQSFVINPGQSQTFPWLASIAQNYQQYKVNGLVFEFVTLSSDITAGGALGSMILATQYDSNANVYPDKIHMENSEYAVSCKPSVSQLHAVECDPSLTSVPIKYIRSINDTSTQFDSRMYDLGLFQVATQGLPGSSGNVLGELWVSYDVSLYKPEIGSQVFQGANIQGGSANKAAILGSAQTVLASPADSVVVADSNTILFNIPGKYLITMLLAGTGITTPGTTASTVAVSYISNSYLTSATNMIEVWSVVVTAAGQIMRFDATGSTSVSSVTLIVAPWSLA
jgi:hypothetical protein